MAEKKEVKKIKKEKGEIHAIANILATFNNTIITVTDQQGNTLCFASGGTVGFKGARKGTPFAAQLAAQKAGNDAREMGVKYIDIKVKGPGAGREAAIRALQATGLVIRSIRDVTPIPHNGCRPPRRRRV